MTNQPSKIHRPSVTLLTNLKGSMCGGDMGIFYFTLIAGMPEDEKIWGANSKG